MTIRLTARLTDEFYKSLILNGGVDATETPQRIKDQVLRISVAVEEPV